jgi:hypothetical protein
VTGRRPKWGRGYAMVPGWLLLKEPSPNALVVYVHLAMHGTFNTGEARYEQCRPSKKTLAEGDPRRGYPGCGLGERTIGRALRELEDLKAIKGEPYFDPKTGAQGATVYRLIFGEIAEEPDDLPMEETAGGHPMSPVTPPAHETSPRVTGDTPPHVTGDTPPMTPVTHHLEPETQNPLPRENLRPPALSASNAAREAAPNPGGIETNPEPRPDADPRRTPAFVALAAELAAAGGWDPAATEETMLALLGAGRAVADITRVLREAAEGKHGHTGSPRRFLSYWPPTMQAPEPEWAKPNVAYLDRDRERCRRHPGEPSGACGRCKADALAVDADDPGPAAHPAEATGLSRRDLAREIARNARTGRAPYRRRPPAEPGPSGGSPPARAGAVAGALVAAMSAAS